ncbi:MAG TPA: tetratricopeptide repeat protein [Thermodesulfovibrionales bacterium]|nr:tetratricopeptide repeat protein [Thermodesulfovibrionales bacterium]
MSPIKKNIIAIRSSRVSEFDTEVEAGGERYLVQTEKGSSRNPRITTRVYFRGRIVFSAEADYREVMHEPDHEKRECEIMRSQHRSAVASLKAQKIRVEKKPADYLEEVQELMKRSRKENALLLLDEALNRHPDNPFLLSYRGYLEATVNKRFREGIAECVRAIGILQKAIPFGEEFFYPLLYLNLGMACLSAGKKKEAVEAFQKGLEIEREHSELLRMMKKLGTRKPPPLPFFSRSHSLNKYLGKLMHMLKK